MIVEISDKWLKNRNYLLENDWKKKYTWLELVRWLDERAEGKLLVACSHKNKNKVDVVFQLNGMSK